MEQLAARLSALQDGQMSAVWSAKQPELQISPFLGIVRLPHEERQFYNGAGWWRCFASHPKCVLAKERARRRQYSWDSGVGIHYWRDKYNGCVPPIDVRLVKEGHCSEIGKRDYRTAANHLGTIRDLRPNSICTFLSIKSRNG